MIFLPPGDISHIPGSLDPVAPPAEDLEILPRPLVTSHRDRPDMVQDAGMMGMRIPRGVGCVEVLSAEGTLPTLLIADKPLHSRDRQSSFEPVLQSAGGLAAEGMLVTLPEV